MANRLTSKTVAHSARSKIPVRSASILDDERLGDVVDRSGPGKPACHDRRYLRH
jgi:hypothetical protein